MIKILNVCLIAAFAAPMWAHSEITLPGTPDFFIQSTERHARVNNVAWTPKLSIRSHRLFSRFRRISQMRILDQEELKEMDRETVQFTGELIEWTNTAIDNVDHWETEVRMIHQLQFCLETLQDLVDELPFPSNQAKQHFFSVFYERLRLEREKAESTIHDKNFKYANDHSGVSVTEGLISTMAGLVASTFLSHHTDSVLAAGGLGLTVFFVTQMFLKKFLPAKIPPKELLKEKAIIRLAHQLTCQRLLESQPTITN